MWNLRGGSYLKTVTVELSKAFNEIELHVFGDDHIGDEHSNTTLIKERIETVRDTPNAYVVLSGDEINNAISNSKSDIYSASMHPSEQIQCVAELYQPIQDRILAIIPGNHTARTWRAAGIDPTRMFALELGLQDKYYAEPILLFIRLGTQTRHASELRPVTYMVYVTHGSGGGKKTATKLGRVEDLAGIVDADVYVHSHVHAPGIFKKDYLRTFPSSCGVTQVTKTFVCTAAALDYGGYGSTNNFSPSCKDNPVIYLSGQKKEVRVMV